VPVLDVAAATTDPLDDHLFAATDHTQVLDTDPGRRIETLPVRRY
jgi:hypothetical protein